MRPIEFRPSPEPPKPPRVVLTAIEREDILRDYRQWSGGFLPEEDVDNIRVYVDLALDTKYEPKKDLVEKWMRMRAGEDDEEDGDWAGLESP